MSIAAINRANFVRRRIGSAVMAFICMIAAVIGLIILTLIIWTLLERGTASLSLAVFTHADAHERRRTVQRHHRVS